MKKILYIEDEPSLLHAFKEKIIGNDVTCIGAKNGEEGLTLALKEHPDLILLDIILPRMDGLTMLEKLRQDDWGKKVKVTVLTNLTDIGAETKAKNLGVEEICIKTDWSINALVDKTLGML